jgi:predicted transcriptional regulator
MSRTGHETDIFNKYNIPSTLLNDNELIETDKPIDDEEIMELMNVAYQIADKSSPTGTRTPFDIEILETKRKQLEEDLLDREKEEKEYTEFRKAVQDNAEKERKKTELSVKREILERINRLQNALKNPKIKELLLKVINHKLTPEQAFASIKENSSLKEQMMRLTLNGVGKRGGKSRVFRRKNKKSTSRTRRSMRSTRRHRKSSSRRGMRK